MNRFSIDIETVSTVSDPDFSEPGHWSPFAVALGHQNASMDDPDVVVVFREDSSLAAEHRMLSNTLDWIADRVEAGTERILLTYNGESYDLPILTHRSRQLDAKVESNLTDRLELMLGGSRHVDLIQQMKKHEGYYVALEEALDMHEIEYDEVEWLDKPVTGKDMLSFGLELMTDRLNDDLREVTRRYAASDVKPLFELHDRLQSTVVD